MEPYPFFFSNTIHSVKKNLIPYRYVLLHLYLQLFLTCAEISQPDQSRQVKKKARFSYPYFEKHVNKIEEQWKNKILDITILRHLWSTKAQYTNSQS